MAMLSYTNFGSSKHPNAGKVTDAVAYLHRYYPDLVVDGPLQSDFALNRDMLEERFPFSEIAKKNKNQSVGPILLGLKEPIHVLQLGASVDEIVNMAAVAVIDAQQKQKR